MKAVNVKSVGNSEQLEIIDLPVPKIKANQVLVKTVAAGVNRPDILQRRGLYNPPPDASKILGLEISGKIVEIGDEVPGDLVGQNIFALTHGGGYAEYCAVDYNHCLLLPPNLSFSEAACIPETAFTVFYNLFLIGGLKEGDKVLIHGGSGGIGSTAIQMARLAGADVVIATAGSDKKCGYCKDNGADHAFNYKTESFSDKIKQSSIGKIDIVLDMLGGEFFEKNISLLGYGGRHLSIAYLAGKDVKLDLGRLMTKQILVTGSTLRPQSPAVKASIANGIKNFLLPLLEEKKFKIRVDREFSMLDVKSAHDLMESREHMGKICLTISQT